jgi:pantetheine-phosphate adenylyltransferase
LILLYPGSFDPVTNGHLDLIARGAALAEKVIVAILRNEAKQPLFALEERIEMIREAAAGVPNLEIRTFGGLTAEFAREVGANAILRGIRAVADYEYELQMALMNRRLNPEVETIFLTASEAHSFISSRLVKEVAAAGGDVAGLVPAAVALRLKDRYTGGRR